MGNPTLISVLDHGYVMLIDVMGSDERIIEAARMSSGKGFLGWGPNHTKLCQSRFYFLDTGESANLDCTCRPMPGDEKLLAYLWNHRHTTPFEQCELSFEVLAPIFVFREWHRHRTQSYNEFSARYEQMPDLHYLPSASAVCDRMAAITQNKQAQGLARKTFNPRDVGRWCEEAEALQRKVYTHYVEGLEMGIPKEIARLNTPVARYSKMRAKANLLNWFRFLGLRMALDAQWEIRQYANAVGNIIESLFPRTFKLFKEKPL